MKFLLVLFALLLSAAAGQGNNAVEGSNYNPRQTKKGGSFQIMASCGYGSGTSQVLASDGVSNECCVNPDDWASIPGGDQCGDGAGFDCADNGGTACYAGTFSNCQKDVCTIYCSSSCAVINPDPRPTVPSGNEDNTYEVGATEPTGTPITEETTDAPSTAPPVTEPPTTKLPATFKPTIEPPAADSPALVSSAQEPSDVSSDAAIYVLFICKPLLMVGAMLWFV